MERRDLAKDYADLQSKLQQDAPEESPDLSKGIFGHEDIANAFNAGRESVVENMPDLEWRQVHCFGKETLEAYPLGASFKIEFSGMEFDVHCNCHFITRVLSLSAAKQAADKHYREMVKQALGL